MRVILFGATGMVGQAVLRECLLDDGVEVVISIARSKTGQSHPKLREIVRADLLNFDTSDLQLQGSDACFFCLGVSSAGMNEGDYKRITYDLTMGWARALAQVNPAMTFIYVSGAGTGGRQMWARVKGRTESELLALFPSAYMIRLAALRPMHDEQSKTRWTRISYRLLKPLMPLLQSITPNLVITTEELGLAMIAAARYGAPKKVLETKDLRKLAKRK